MLPLTIHFPVSKGHLQGALKTCRKYITLANEPKRSLEKLWGSTWPKVPKPVHRRDMRGGSAASSPPKLPSGWKLRSMGLCWLRDPQEHSGQTKTSPPVQGLAVGQFVASVSPAAEPRAGR